MVVDDPSVGKQVVKHFAADAALLHANLGVTGEFGGVHAGKYGQWQAQGVSLRAATSGGNRPERRSDADPIIEQDAASGKLDNLAAEALADYRAGSPREL